MLTNKEKVQIQINLAKAQLDDYCTQYDYRIADNKDSKDITGNAPLQNISNILAVAAEIKARRYALRLLEELLSSITD